MRKKKLNLVLYGYFKSLIRNLTSERAPPYVNAGEILPFILKRTFFPPATPFCSSEAVTVRELPVTSIFVWRSGISPTTFETKQLHDD